MMRRPIAGQTGEQRFCGTWYDCRHCMGSILIPSPALIQQWRAIGIKVKI